MSTTQDFQTTRYAAVLAQAEKDEAAQRENGRVARVRRIADRAVGHLIDQKDCIIEGQRRVIKDLRATIARKDAEILRRDIESSADPDIRIATLKTTVKERDEMIAGLRQTIARLESRA